MSFTTTSTRVDYIEVTRFGGPVEYICVEGPVLLHGGESVGREAQPWKCQSCGGPNESGAKCQYCGGVK